MSCSFSLLEYKQLLNQLYRQPKMSKYINIKDKGKISNSNTPHWDFSPTLPSLDLNFSNLPFGRALVMMSASWSFELQCSNLTFFDSSASQMAWYLTLMWLVLPCWTGFLAITIADLLSTLKMVASLWTCLTLDKNFLNQMAWFDTAPAEICPASAITSCFFKPHDKVPLPNEKT